MVWLPDGEKILNKYLFVSTEYTNMTYAGREADTARRHRPRLCKA